MGTEEEQHREMKRIREMMAAERQARAILWVVTVALLCWAGHAAYRLAWLLENPGKI